MRPCGRQVYVTISGVLIAALVLSACDPFNTQFAPTEDAVMYQAATLRDPPTSVITLKVMTWNVKFGGGRLDFFFDCHGDRSLMTETEVRQHLRALATKIKQVDPDLVVLQEVDVRSKRSAYVDMMQALLDDTHLNYGAYASQWRADYVPSDGIGRVDSGNGLLSRWPIHDATRIALPLVGEYSGIKRYFYLKRNLLRARIAAPGQGDVYVVNVHAEAYSNDGTKQRHIDRFKEELDTLASGGALVIGAGDLNVIPPGSTQVKDYPDAVCTDAAFVADDYTDELDWLDALYADFASAIPLSDYQADNHPYLSHSSAGDTFWNRKLDYIFTNGVVVVGSGLTHQAHASGGMDTMPMSDHAPITVQINR